jgi:preprotein translocase subunit SecF
MTQNNETPTTSKPKMLRILKETSFEFLKHRRLALIISTILVGIGLFAAVEIFATGGANLGIEFTGGTSITLAFDEEIPLNEARALLINSGFTNPQVTNATSANTYKLIIRVKEGVADVAEGDNVSEIPAQIQSLFEREYSDIEFQGADVLSIGPAVGNELREKAIYAMLYAIIGIILYVAVRFDFKFGVAATLAMFHDVIAVIGIMYLKNFIWPTEFTLLIMTAILTLAGYSLTDTVVVFDRIRENLKRRQRLPLETTINHSINQVLSRTVVTSLTTLLVVVSIFFLGGSVLNNFAFALITGILVGTYSSIFVASPLLVMWQGGKGKLIGGEGVRKATPQRAKSG